MEEKLEFYPGFDIKPTTNPIGFELGDDCFSNGVEVRKLDAIRKSLMDPSCDGPSDVYAIMMDVGKKKDYEDLVNRHLLYGVVCYAKGTLGKEPVRSQGHIHAISKFSLKSTPEIYEIFEGTAIIYMQEYGDDNPGRCFAVIGNPGDVIVVPPYYVHATINANKDKNMSFGAWCVRDYGFEYEKVRAHGGIAFFPIYENDKLVWVKNEKYKECKLEIKNARSYEKDLKIKQGVPIYTQYENDHSMFDFVIDPDLKEEAFEHYEP